MESTSSARRRTKPPTRNRFLVEGKRKDLPCLFCFAEGFASAEATRGLSDRPLDPFGAPLSVGAETEQINLLWKARERAFLTFPILQRISPLRRRPGGFPVAPWTPSGGGRKPCREAVLACCETKGFTFTWAYKKRARFSAAYGCGRSFRSGHALFIAFSKLPDGTAPAWGKSPTSPPASAG